MAQYTWNQGGTRVANLVSHPHPHSGCGQIQIAAFRILGPGGMDDAYQRGTPDPPRASGAGSGGLRPIPRGGDFQFLALRAPPATRAA